MKLANVGLLVLSFASVAADKTWKEPPKTYKKKKNKKKKNKKQSGMGGGGDGGYTPPKCVTYFQDSTDTRFFGTNSSDPKVGDQFLWSNSELATDEWFDYLVGTSSGHCIVTEDKEMGGTEVRQYCHTQFIFGDNWHSTLTFDGAAPNELEMASLLTITGGSGKFKKIRGYAKTTPIKDYTIFVTEICRE